MPFDKPRIFSTDRRIGESTPSAESGSERAIGFGLQSDQATGDSVRGDLSIDQELGLSTELQVLAAHLRGEADSLAERYAPATCPTSPPARDRRFGRQWIWQVTAAGVAGLALLAWRIDRWQESPPAAPADVASRIAAPGDVVVQQQQDVAVIPRASVPLPLPALPIVAPGNLAQSETHAISHSQGIAEVGIDGPAVERHPPADQIEMLRIQVLGFEKVIRKLQSELVARDAAQIDSVRQIQSLQEEVRELHKQLEGHR